MSDFLAAARSEAARLQHDYVGTEHLLLALVQAEEPALVTVLSTFSATPSQLRERIEKRCPQGKGTPENPEEIALRSGARRALEQARSAAGGGEPTAQQLLGALLGDGRGVVASSLGDLAIPVPKVREALGFEPSATPAAAEPAAPAPRQEKAPRRQEKPDRAEKAERPPRPEKPPKAERPPRPERGEGRGERVDAPRRAEAAERRPDAGAAREEPRLSRNDGPPRIAPVHEPFLTWRKLPLLAIPASLYLGFAG
ncbi:MAG TPA: Clp protease N-terminal domain-containing protein, partial [Gemmatimonadales bacterium]|nr:Clp protease N-terminal domain-containing protein [Gemmatimonadales bacterium]